MAGSSTSIVQHNIPALNAYHNYFANNTALSRSLEKLSSGYKINRAGDDAAGLAISEKMRAQLTGLEVAQKNAKDGISLVQTAEGALTEVHSMLNRMVTLAEQSANGTYADDVDREQIQKEIDSLRTEIDRIADSSNFNGIKLLDGSLDGTNGTAAKSAEWSFDTVNIDATKTKQDVFLADALVTGTGAKTTFESGDQVKLDIGLSDGTSKTITLTANVTRDTTNDANSKITFTDQDGNEVFKKTGAGLVDTNGAVGLDNGTTATKLNLTDITSAVTEALKETDLNDTYKFKDSSEAAKDQLIKMSAREAGAGTVEITSIKQSVIDKDGNDVTATTLKSTIDAVTTGATGTYADTTAGDLARVATTHGKDGVAAFKSDDIVLYNDDANGGKGNAEDAVFTINGKKFAIGVRNGGPDGKKNNNSTVKNLGDDVTFISLDAHTSASVKAADDAIKVGAEGVAKRTDVAITLNDPDDAMQDQGTKTLVDFDKAALNQILSEMSKALGVEVTYEAANWEKIGTTTNYQSTQLEDGDAILDATAAAKYGTQGFFKVADTPGTKASGTGLTLQIGDTSDSFNRMGVSIANMHTSALGTKDKDTGKLTATLADIDVSTQEGAQAAMDVIKNAINQVSDTRGGLGALQNRLDHTINNLSVMQENIQAAESLIRDVDVAQEMMNFTKLSIMNQASQAMLAQANQLPQGVLQMIQ